MAQIINPLDYLTPDKTGNPFYHPLMPGGLNMVGGIQSIFNDVRSQNELQRQNALKEREQLLAEKKGEATIKKDYAMADYYSTPKVDAPTALSLRMGLASGKIQAGEWTQEQGEMYAAGTWTPKEPPTERDLEFAAKVMGIPIADIKNSSQSQQRALIQKANEVTAELIKQKAKPKTGTEKGAITETSIMTNRRDIDEDIQQLRAQWNTLASDREVTTDILGKVQAVSGFHPDMPDRFNRILRLKILSPDKKLLQEGEDEYLQKMFKLKAIFLKLKEQLGDSLTFDEVAARYPSILADPDAAEALTVLFDVHEDISQGGTSIWKTLWDTASHWKQFETIIAGDAIRGFLEGVRE